MGNSCKAAKVCTGFRRIVHCIRFACVLLQQFATLMKEVELSSFLEAITADYRELVGCVFAYKCGGIGAFLLMLGKL